MSTKAYTPAIEVRLVKTAKRTTLGGGATVAARYKDFSAIDLTPYISEGTACTVQRALGAPSGGWGLSLVDRMVPECGESLYALIEPQDVIEIRMAHNPADYHGKLPIVMRGFVSRVTRSRSIGTDGRPMRVITVTGHDYGKVLEVLRIYYLVNSVIGDNITSGLSFFQKYAGYSEAKIMSAADFVALVNDDVITKFLSVLTASADGAKIGAAKIVQQFTPKVSVKGLVSPQDVSAFDGGSVYDFLCSFLDVGAFNELLVEDTDTSVDLVVRPNAFLGIDGKPIQPTQGAESAQAGVPIIDIDAEDLKSITESRSDDNVANYFWVENGAWQIINNMPMKDLASAGEVADYALMDYPNTSSARFGFKKLEASSALAPPGVLGNDTATKAQVDNDSDVRLNWLVARRKILADQNKDNLVFESGSMLVRGNEQIKRGCYVRVHYGDYVAIYYVTSVTHQFILYGSFLTQITFERGTNFIARAQRGTAPYVAELNLKGA